MSELVSVAPDSALPMGSTRERRTVRHLILAAIISALVGGLGVVSAPEARAQSSLAPAILAEAAEHRGTPYRRGGSSPGRGFDCSGYVQYVFGQVGVGLPRTAAAIRRAVPQISASQAAPGDLVFVHRGRRVSHVAIYAGSGMWWEATRPGRRLNLNKAWTSRVSYGRVG